MARRPPSLWTWLSLPTGALLCLVACRHEPDFVGRIEASSIENAGDSGSADAGAHGGSGAGASSGTTGGRADAGSSVTNTGKAGRGDSGAGGSSAGNGGNSDAGGRGDSGSGANPIEKCPTPQFYWTIKTIVDDDCKFIPALYPVVRAFFEQVPPELPVPESRQISTCNFSGGVLYPLEDGRIGVCVDACNGVKDWLAEQDEELKRCMGLIDAGVEP